MIYHSGWGSNTYGQLGDRSTTDKRIPNAVSGGGVWSQISGGTHHTCGLKSDGSAWCEFSWYSPSFAPMLSLTSLILVIYPTGWGYNWYGQLGDGSTNDKNVPTAVSGGGVWSQISAGWSLTCGVRGDGSAWCEFSWYSPSLAPILL